MKYDSTQRQRQEEQEREWRERREKEEEEARKEIRNKIGFKVLTEDSSTLTFCSFYGLTSFAGRPILCVCSNLWRLLRVLNL